MKAPHAQLSRRQFLRRFGLMGAAGAVLPAFYGEPATPLTCTDVSALTPQQVQTREALQYADASPVESRYCKGCQFFVKSEKEGTCGGCKVVPGPIHPDGYCTAWAALQG